MKLAAWIIVATVAVGCSGGTVGDDRSAEEVAQAPDGPSRHEIAVGTTGFTPAVVQARKGRPVTLVFTRTTEETCGHEVVMISEDIKVELPLNEPVEVTLVPTEAGEIQFQCGMDMLTGKVVVN